MDQCEKCGCGMFRRGPFGERICTGCGEVLKKKEAK